MSEQSKFLPWQERVIEEHQELGIKIGKLDAFTKTDGFRALSPRSREQLERQLEAMWEYCGALGDRLCDF